jgi:hypothetical protein
VLDLTPLAAVTSVGDNFLAGCSSLRALDLTPLAALTRSGGGFLAECASLSALDLAPLTTVTRVGNDFAGATCLGGSVATGPRPDAACRSPSPPDCHTEVDRNCRPTLEAPRREDAANVDERLTAARVSGTLQQLLRRNVENRKRQRTEGTNELE